MDKGMLNEKIVGLLRKKCAILKESRDTTPHLLILPDHPDISLHDINTILDYLVHVAWSYDSGALFRMVVDRRNNSWTSVRSLFVSLQKLPWYERSVKEVYLLNPTGLLTSVFRFLSFPQDKKVNMVQSAKEIDELFSAPFHSLSQSQPTSDSPDQSNQSLSRSFDQSQTNTETSSSSAFSMLQRAAQSQKTSQKASQSRRESLCVSFIESFNADEWIEDRKTIESLNNYMVSMQNALKPQPPSSYPDDDEEEEEDDDECTKNETKPEEDTTDEMRGDIPKTLKPPRPPQPSLSSPLTRPSSSSSSSSVDYQTKMTSSLPLTDAKSSPSSSSSSSSLALKQILTTTPPPINTPTYDEIKQKSYKQIKAIKKNRLRKYHRVLDKMAATHVSCDAIIKSLTSSLPCKHAQVQALSRISAKMAAVMEGYRKDVEVFEEFMGRVLNIMVACRSVSQLREEREKEEEELERLCRQYNLTRYLGNNKSNKNNNIEKVNNQNNSREKINTIDVNGDNSEKYDGNGSEKKMNDDINPKIQINDDDQKILNNENNQKIINSHDNKDGGWDTFRQSPISWERDLDIFKNSNEIHNLIDRVENMQNNNQVRRQTLSEKQCEIERLTEETETVQKDEAPKTLNKNSQTDIDRKTKAMERTQTHSKLLEELTNTYRDTEKDIERDGVLLKSLSKHLSSCLQLYTELDKVEKWQSEAKEIEKEGTKIINKVKVLIHSLDGVTEVEDYNDSIVLLVDKWRRMKSRISNMDAYENDEDGDDNDKSGNNDDDKNGDYNDGVNDKDGVNHNDDYNLNGYNDDDDDDDDDDYKNYRLNPFYIKKLVDRARSEAEEQCRIVDCLVNDLIGKGAELSQKKKEELTKRTKSNKKDDKKKKGKKAKIIVDSSITSNILANHNASLNPVQSPSIQNPPSMFGSESSNSIASSNYSTDSIQLPIQSSLDDGLPGDTLDMDKYICSQKDEISKIVDDTEEVRIKRRHVIGELIETEKTYTNDLKDIIEGYMEGLVGTPLLKDRENIFGNIRDIYQFHSGVFLRCLQEGPEDPVHVAGCFIQHKQSFLIYMTYCQNKVNSSDLIMNSLTDAHPCFEQCRQRLGHRLPLSSYLLKPVQRITKYHLILRDLSKVLITWEEVKMMNRCMQCVQEVVRQVNNSLHQLSILNYPGDLRTLGRLLFQGMLEVSVEKKSTSPIRPTNLHKRHVFLYDREILLCKKKENTCQHPSYIYKTSLKNDEIGPLRDKEDRRFEVVNKGEVWCFVAALQSDKLAWVEEIKRVLFEQMQSMRSKTRRIQLNNSIDTARDVQRPSSQLIDNNNNNVVFFKSISNNK